MKDPDPALLERCQQQDAEAFAQLVAEQQDYVYTLARRVLRDPEDGTSQPATEAIVRAPDGSVWLAREAGLAIAAVPGCRGSCGGGRG